MSVHHLADVCAVWTVPWKKMTQYAYRRIKVKDVLL